MYSTQPNLDETVFTYLPCIESMIIRMDVHSKTHSGSKTNADNGNANLKSRSYINVDDYAD